MPITAQCPGCKQSLSVPDQYAGAQANCPTCGTAVVFPAAGAPPAPPAYAPPPPAAPPAQSAWEPAGQAYPAAPAGPPRDNTELLTTIGLGVGIGFLALLALSTFLHWFAASAVFNGPGGGVRVLSLGSSSGLRFGDGRLVLLLSLLLGAAVGWNFFSRKFLSLTMVLAGAFGTFAFMVMLAHIGRFAGAGIYVGLVAAMGVMGGCIWTAVRCPLTLAMPGAATQPAFTRVYGALLGSQTAALVFGVIYWILRAAS